MACPLEKTELAKGVDPGEGCPAGAEEPAKELDLSKFKELVKEFGDAIDNLNRLPIFAAYRNAVEMEEKFRRLANELKEIRTGGENGKNLEG